jgi:uncharacterized protein (DUF305 family)
MTKKDPFLYGVIGAVIGGLVIWYLTASAVIYPRSIALQAPAQGTIDTHFIEQMIPHHEDAITMANLALEKSADQNIRQLATNIIASQGEEINKMQQWYQSWFGKAVPEDTQTMAGHMMQTGDMHMGMMGDQTDINRLTQANDFDRLFLEQMIPHHQMAVMMASMLQAATNREEMSQLAADIIRDQNAEIDLMRSWLQ